MTACSATPATTCSTGGDGNDSVFGGAGNDLLAASLNDGDDTYYGGDISADAGTDTLDMGLLTAAAVVDLGTGVGGRGSAVSAQSGTDALWGVENVVTGSGDDTITASTAVNVIDGGAGRGCVRLRFGRRRQWRHHPRVRGRRYHRSQWHRRQ